MKAPGSLPKSRRWKRRAKRIFIVVALLALFGLSAGPIGYLAALIMGLPFVLPFWIAGSIAGLLEDHRARKLQAEAERQAALLDDSQRCMGPGCEAWATKRSVDGPWIWCEAHAGPADVAL